ncbi:MAG: cob(I)yrinic acid a,c-diamide adenosyltransferase [Acidobacteria bacterium]|nr:cob(I)yrinic acid a,c-diamide adenosyltransferase [Acidobacteriota bacterium]
MKIYTKTGDSGETSLFSGERKLKSDLRVAAYGDVDELNAFLGMAVLRISVEGNRALLRRIQNRLFNLGADLATTDTRPLQERIDETEIREMEAAIDAMDVRLPELRTFILPGGTEAAVWLHLCRVVCRRAERSVVRLQSESSINPLAVVFLNRLSDLLFMMARFENLSAGTAELNWGK